MVGQQGKGIVSMRLLGVVAFATLVALAGLWTMPPLDRDEARFAQATAQMLESGDFVEIKFQDQARNKKPIGIHWLQAASVSAFSETDSREIWAYRLPSVIGVILAAIFTYLTGRRLYDRETGFFAAILLASAPIIAAEATLAKTDAMLLAMICMAQYAFVCSYGAGADGRSIGWRGPIAFWATQGAGVLIKGPIAPIISGLTGIGLVVAERRLDWRFLMRPIFGVIVVVLIAAPWAYAIYTATDGQFFLDAFSADLVAKMRSGQEEHGAPPGYHSILVWGLFWPAAALIGPGLLTFWREPIRWQERFLLAWLILGWIVFELTATKLPHYTMPLYPVLAIVAARAINTYAHTNLFLKRAGAITYGGVGLLFASLFVVLPLSVDGREAGLIDIAMTSFFAVSSLFVASLFWRSNAKAGAFSAAILSGLLAWGLLNHTLPRLAPFTLTTQLSAALEENHLHPLKNDVRKIAIAGYSEPSAVFLIGTETVLTNGADAANRFINGEIGAAAIEARHKEAFLSIAGERAKALAQISALNYSKGNDVEITLYVPAQSND